MRRAWILNLDAERELAHPQRSADPFAALEHRPHLARDLSLLVADDSVLRRGDRVVDAPPNEAADTENVVRGFAWCPTPSALAALARAGARPPKAPSAEVLRKVNHRAFSASVGSTVEAARFATTTEDALQHISSPSPTGAWLLKRPLGFAGRGRAIAPPLSDALRRFVHTSIADEGGVQIEPLFERSLDISIHGFVDDIGQLTVGSPTLQLVSQHGAWSGSREPEPGELEDPERALLEAEANHVAEALTKEGYFGPFGIDAFRYELAGVVKLQPRCEINARYTMGWALGMGARRPDRL